MARLLLDTSVYIPLLRKGKQPGDFIEAPSTTLFLSAVVAQELMAGAGDLHTMKALEKFCDLFLERKRFLVPADEDWIDCGKILSGLGKKHGYESIKRGRLVNDVLIALGCRRANATLITSNVKDFQMIRQFVPFYFLGI